MDPAHFCTFCGKPVSKNSKKVVTVQSKGLKTLKTKSRAIKDDKWKLWEELSSIRVHEKCRLNYLRSSSTSLKQAEKSTKSSTPTSNDPSSSPLDSSDRTKDLTFQFEKLCFICGKDWSRHRGERSIVKNDFIKDRLMSKAPLRNDNTGEMLMQRLRGISSLVQVKARYHKSCYDRFSIIPTGNPIGRPVDQDIEAAFKKVCEHIEQSDSSEFLLATLQRVMGENAMTTRTLFRKLRDKYGDDIHIAQHVGKHPVVYYKIFNLSQICQEWLCDKESLGEEQKSTILQVAAGILRSEILTMEYNTESCNPLDEFLDTLVEDMPNLLTTFLGNMIFSEKAGPDNVNFARINSIAHAIVSTVQPESFISHLQLSVGSYIHKKTGSKLIIDLLAKLGVCASYDKVQLFEASTMRDPFDITGEKNIRI